MITLRTRVRKDCPYKNERDDGELIITLPGDAPELHALGELVAGMAVDPISHEEYTRRIRAALPEGAVVTTTWRTGRWDVTVTES